MRRTAVNRTRAFGAGADGGANAGRRERRRAVPGRGEGSLGEARGRWMSARDFDDDSAGGAV